MSTKAIVLTYVFIQARTKTIENCEWKRFHNEELHSLYSASNIVRAIKSRGLRWAVHIAKMEKMGPFKVLTDNHTRKSHLEQN